MIEVDGWRQACDTNACIQAKFNDDGTVHMRSSERPATLWFTRAEWDAFVAGVKGGEFDDLAQPGPH